MTSATFTNFSKILVWLLYSFLKIFGSCTEKGGGPRAYFMKIKFNCNFDLL